MLVLSTATNDDYETMAFELHNYQTDFDEWLSNRYVSKCPLFSYVRINIMNSFGGWFKEICKL